MPDFLPNVWPIIVVVSIGCVLLAVVLAWPWICDAVLRAESDAEGECPHDLRFEHKDIGGACIGTLKDAVEPLNELDTDDLHYLAWWMRQLRCENECESC